MTSAFDPIRIGRWDLPQRFVMAPLTRNRAGKGMAPTELNATYYGQRAGAGLIISEGTQPSERGQGYLNTPGIHTPEQIAGWRKVADAVHADGGTIVIQLMHAGRIAHSDNKNGLETVAPSAVQAPGEMITVNGPKPHDQPRALETDELPQIIAEYVHAAQSTIEAGADGVELHAANGYLLHQFLAPNTNQRTDGYGGSPQARARFVIEVAQAVADAIGADRVGMRISPGHAFNGIEETDPADIRATYQTLVDGIAPLGLAYLSILADPAAELTQDLRRRFGGPVIVNSGFGSITTLQDVDDILQADLGDAVAVGREFIANPDLPARWRAGADLNEIDDSTFYGGGAKGYTDYPQLTA
ncbi:alkene reductase [Calidifontibacter sp. DB0510]|uniref:Alkene reductase n=1 Tax=Metallococcus carri TaxID=1656884 RepID=A0A967B340_9MICO|nr:alkene reductase [Metallococcus carri]NHN57142.1 alkene reductase [Metallococcus carri]NOP38055.1 alkene reductase [Calidifontibacter sp. DB2511S]